jgi:hypothetical protein
MPATRVLRDYYRFTRPEDVAVAGGWGVVVGFSSPDTQVVLITDETSGRLYAVTLDDAEQITHKRGDNGERTGELIAPR